MRKIATLSLAVLAVLLLAATSFAALPLELNNTQWAFKGIQFNASAPVYTNIIAGTVDSNGSYMGITKAESYGNNIGSLNGSLTLTNYLGSTTTKTITKCSGPTSGACWNSSAGQVDLKGVASVLSLGNFNPDSTGSQLYFVPVDGYGTILGASENSSMNGGGGTNGTVMSALIAPKLASASDMAGTWKIYGVDLDSYTTEVVIGEMSLNTNGSSAEGTGTLSLVYRTAGTTDWSDVATANVIWTVNSVNDIDIYLSTNGSDFVIKDAVMDKSKKAMYTVFRDGDNYDGMLVAVKGDQFTSSSLLAGYNLIAAGADSSNGTVTFGHMDVLTGGIVSSTDGNQTFVADGELGSTDFAGTTLGIEEVTLGTLKNTNMTFTAAAGSMAGYFTGARRTDGKMLVGIYHDALHGSDQLMFIVGQAAEAGPVYAPTATEVKTLTGMDLTNATGSGFSAGSNLSYVTSTTAISDTYASNDTTNFPQASASALYQSMQLGDEDVAASFPGAPSGYTRITPAWTPSVFALNGGSANSTATNPALVIVSWQIDTVGTGMQYKRVSEMAMYKFRATNDGTANQTVAYTQRTASYPGMPVADIANKADGHYWITDAAYNKTALEGSDYFRPGNKYVIWTVLQDNGAYDSHRDYGVVADPPAGSAATAASSSSSSGCIFNPMAGFGLEWLLLLLAPALGIIRSRKR